MELSSRNKNFFYMDFLIGSFEFADVTVGNFGGIYN